MGYCWPLNNEGCSRWNIMDDAQLRTVWEQRQFAPPAMPLSAPLTSLMKHTLARRVKQLSRLAEVWDDLIPQEIRDHTALEGFRDGVLTVMVDSASHRFQLQTLLSAGLMKQIQSRLPLAVNRVRLVPGQFSSLDLAGSPRYEF